MNEKIFLIFGDYFFRKEKKKEILSSIQGKYSVSEIEEADDEVIFKFLVAPSLFDEIKVLVTEKVIVNKKTEPLLKRVSSSGNILIVEGNEASDGESFFNKIKGFCPAVVISCESPKKKKDVEKFIKERCDREGILIQKDAISLLAEYCGNNYSIVYEEINKLNIVVSPNVIGVKEIKQFVVSIGEKKSVLDLYVSFMTGDTSECISNSRKIIAENSPEEVFSCIMKITELCLLLSCYNGNKNNLVNYFKKERKLENMGILRSRYSETVEKQKAPSDFMIRVSQKIYERIKSEKRIRSLFVRAYNYFSEYRFEANNELASSHIDEIMCALCRRN